MLGFGNDDSCAFDKSRSVYRRKTVTEEFDLDELVRVVAANEKLSKYVLGKLAGMAASWHTAADSLKRAAEAVTPEKIEAVGKSLAKAAKAAKSTKKKKKAETEYMSFPPVLDDLVEEDLIVNIRPAKTKTKKARRYPKKD